MAAQISPTLFERGSARSVIAFRREQRMATADAVVKRLSECARVNSPTKDVELAAAGRRPFARGQSVDRRPGLIFRVVMRDDAAIDKPSLESFTPSPYPPFKTIPLHVNKPGQHRGRPWNN